MRCLIKRQVCGLLVKKLHSMTLTILTPTGTAVIKNSQSKAGYKALIAYLRRMQVDRVPFVVLPQGTAPTDLHHVTSAANIA